MHVPLAVDPASHAEIGGKVRIPRDRPGKAALIVLEIHVVCRRPLPPFFLRLLVLPLGFRQSLFICGKVRLSRADGCIRLLDGIGIRHGGVRQLLLAGGKVRKLLLQLGALGLQGRLLVPQLLYELGIMLRYLLQVFGKQQHLGNVVDAQKNCKVRLPAHLVHALEAGFEHALIIRHIGRFFRHLGIFQLNALLLGRDVLLDGGKLRLQVIGLCLIILLGLLGFFLAVLHGADVGFDVLQLLAQTLQLLRRRFGIGKDQRHADGHHHQCGKHQTYDADQFFMLFHRKLLCSKKITPSGACGCWTRSPRRRWRRRTAQTRPAAAR